MKMPRGSVLFFLIILAFYTLTATTTELADNRAPDAHAGFARTVSIGDAVVLDASRSTDFDGDWIDFHWTLETPAGSGAQLSDANAVRPHFAIDMLGDYVAELVVSDGIVQSAADTVLVSTANIGPVAIAGDDFTIRIGETALLDATASRDFDGDALDYRWTLISAPAGSTAALLDADTMTAALTADVSGDYVLELSVSDGKLDGRPDRVRVSTVNSWSRADAGPDRMVSAGSRLRLDGTASSDVDNDVIDYRWSILHAPGVGRAILSRTATARPMLTTSAPGIYVVQLRVSDGSSEGTLDTVVIEAIPPRDISTLKSPSRTTELDVDGDGVVDDDDNCVHDLNPDQTDTDADGFGNLCDPDIDNNGITNFSDLAIVKDAFFSSPGSPNWDPDADFNGDGMVNFGDLLIMKNFFFGPPGPIVNRFVNPAGGSWHDPANWSLGLVPGGEHTVRIDLDPGIMVEYSTGDSSIAGLRGTTDFVFSGGSLNVPGDMQVNASFTASGGILANANILAPTTPDEITVPNNAYFTFDGVTLGADVSVGESAWLNVKNGLTLDGATITVAGGYTWGNPGYGLRVRGADGASSTLGGTGEVVFGGTAGDDSFNVVQVYDNGHGLIVDTGVTIRSGTSGGLISHYSSSSGPITLRGTVISNLADHTVTVRGSPLSIEGTLQGLNGGHLTVNSQGVGSSLTGTATMSGGGGLRFDAAAATAWTIAASASIDVNAGNLRLFGSWTSDATINVTDGLLDIGNTHLSAWHNNGTITLSNTTLVLGGNLTLADIGTVNGAGTVIFNGSLDNTGQTLDVGTYVPGISLLLDGGVIIGGSIVNTPLNVPNNAYFTFDGVTLGADVSVGESAWLNVKNGLTLDGATITVAGGYTWGNPGYGLRVRGADGASSTLGGTGEVVFGGTAGDDSFNVVQVYDNGHGLIVDTGVTIRSGTSGGLISHYSSSSGPITLRGTVISNLADHTVTVRGSPLSIEGTLQGLNGGHLTVTPQGVGSSLTGTATMSGGGGLRFDAAAATAWTIAASASIDVNAGNLRLFGSWTSDATINVTDGLLDIGDTHSSAWHNNGTITLSSTTLHLGGNLTLADIGTVNGAGTVIFNGSLDNTGQTLDVGTYFPGISLLLDGGVIIGGSIVNTPLNVPNNAYFTFDGVTLGADVSVGESAWLNVKNGLTLDGATITVAGGYTWGNPGYGLRVRGADGASSTLGGTGEVVFGGTAGDDNFNVVQVYDNGHGLIVDTGVTIRSGTSGGLISHYSSSSGPITLRGTVISNLADHTVTVRGSPLSIEGTLQAGAGSVINLSDYALTATAAFDVDIGGTATTDFGRFTAAGATANLDGTLNIALVNAFSPALSDTFQIMTFATRNGTFATENGTGIGGGLFFQVNHNATDVALEVVN